MNTMLYEPFNNCNVLDKGTYKGFNYYIISLGTHPTAYIEIPKDNKYYNKNIDYIDIDVHGGISYSRNYLYLTKLEKIDGWFIGWDYAHVGDFTGDELLFPEEFRTNGKMWTTEEILEDVKDACEQIIEKNNISLYKKTIINLIRSYCEKDDKEFYKASHKIASEFDNNGDEALAEYIYAQFNETDVWIPQ